MGSIKETLQGGLDSLKKKGTEWVDKHQDTSPNPIAGVTEVGSAAAETGKDVYTKGKALGKDLYNDMKFIMRPGAGKDIQKMFDKGKK
jgi:hypothetical protein